jgi:hypothetical protein
MCYRDLSGLVSSVFNVRGDKMNEVQAELLQRAILNIEKLKERVEALEQRFQSDVKLTLPEISRVHIGARVYLKKLIIGDNISVGTWGAIIAIEPEGIGVIFEKSIALRWIDHEHIDEYLEFAHETYEDLVGYVYGEEKMKEDATRGLFKCLERRGIINP